MASHQAGIKSEPRVNGIGELPPAVRRDYIAVVVEGTDPSEHATRRGVNTSTVCSNVRRGTRQLAAKEAAPSEGATGFGRDEGYKIELVPVGGREPDGSPSAVGKWTFQTRVVRERVTDALPNDGRVLNACAGETVLDVPNDVWRNDLDPDRPALDSTVDVSEIGDRFADNSFAAVIFDPPFDEGQAAAYSGMKVESIAAAREELAALVRPGGVFIELGWSSHSVGQWAAWDPQELVLFPRSPTVPDVFLSVDRLSQTSLLSGRPV